MSTLEMHMRGAKLYFKASRAPPARYPARWGGPQTSSECASVVRPISQSNRPTSAVSGHKRVVERQPAFTTRFAERTSAALVQRRPVKVRLARRTRAPRSAAQALAEAHEPFQPPLCSTGSNLRHQMTMNGRERSLPVFGVPPSPQE